MHRVTVLGGGITGLAASYFLSRMKGVEVTLFESSRRLGGKVLSLSMHGAVAETGPDSIVERDSSIMELCRELGLEGQVIRPKSAMSYLWHRGKLRQLPAGIFSGYPSSGLRSLARSRTLTIPGLFRVAMEPMIPKFTVGDRTSVGELVGRRFGSEFKEVLVDPLIGGIMSCRSDYLSAKETLPVLYNVARNRHSILRSSRTRSHSSPAVRFFSFKGGIQEITRKLDSSTPSVTKHLDQQVLGVEKEEGCWHVRSRDFEVESDAVIVTIPPFAAAPLLGKLEGGLYEILESFNYTSVATVLLAYRSGDFIPPAPGTGFLVPERDGLLMTGCSWLSSKWSNAEAEGIYLVRCFVGTADDQRWKEMPDDRLASELQSELEGIVRIGGKPLDYAVTRFEKGIPQYRVGHAEQVDRLRNSAPGGLLFAGAAYSGVGISSCIADARKAAESIGS